MSEKEIIEEFKELIYNPDYNEILLCTEDGFTGWHELFKNVLDLYQQEKEKNQELKVLIEQNLKYSHNLEKDLFENCSNYVVSKDKIKEELTELDNMKVGGEVFTTAVNFAKKILQELLEEE